MEARIPMEQLFGEEAKIQEVSKEVQPLKGKETYVIIVNEKTTRRLFGNFIFMSRVDADKECKDANLVLIRCGIRMDELSCSVERVIIK